MHLRLLAFAISLALPMTGRAGQANTAPQAGDASQPLPDVQLPANLFTDPVDEPATAERLIDEQEQHIRRLRALQRRVELQAAERDVQKAVAETEQARAEADKARLSGRPPAPAISRESQGNAAAMIPAPSLVGLTRTAAVLDYAGAVHTVALNQRFNGWLVRELGFDYVVLEGPGGDRRRQELGW